MKGGQVWNQLESQPQWHVQRDKEKQVGCPSLCFGSCFGRHRRLLWPRILNCTLKVHVAKTIE